MGGGADGLGEEGAEKAERIIPEEIDDHYRLYGKEPWEVDYDERCPLCSSRIDEYGLCSCGSSGD